MDVFSSPNKKCPGCGLLHSLTYSFRKVVTTTWTADQLVDPDSYHAFRTVRTTAFWGRYICKACPWKGRLRRILKGAT